MVIVCGTDLATPGDTAAMAALLAARAFGDEVELDAVVDPGFDRRVLANSTAARSPTHAAELELEAERKRIPTFGVDVSNVVLEGDPAHALVARARARDARLIVLGQNGHHLPSLFYRRNVVDRTLQEADRPVLIVTTGADELDEAVAPLAGLQRWASGMAPLRVMAVLEERGDDDAEDERSVARVLSFVSSLRRHHACDVTLVAPFVPSLELRRASEPLALGEADPSLPLLVEQRLEERLAPLDGEGRRSIVGLPVWDRSALPSVLDAEARLLDADLVVMPAHRHGAWDAFVGRAPELELAGLSHAPIVCVPVELMPVAGT